MPAPNFVRIGPELEICYRQSGNGATCLLMVPGWTMDSTVFSRQLEFFENSGDVRAIAMDPRSHGLSGKTEDGNHYAQQGHDLHDFILALDLDNIVLCGWSFATLAILAYVHFHGMEKLSGLIMLDGPPRASGENNQDEWVTYLENDRDGFRRFFTEGVLGDRESFCSEFANWMLEDRNETNIRWITDISCKMDASTAADLNESSVNLDYTRELVSMDGIVPLLYAMREERGEVARNWASIHTPSAQIVSLGRHLMFWERSVEFNQMLSTFIYRTVIG